MLLIFNTQTHTSKKNSLNSMGYRKHEDTEIQSKTQNNYLRNVTNALFQIKFITE